MYLALRKPRTPAPDNSGGPPSSQLPSYTLSAQEEQDLAQFVNNFVSLYNSYSYQDTSNPGSLGNFETLRMQNETIQLMNELDARLRPGYKIRTAADASSFSYDYPSAQNLVANIQARVMESQNNTPTRSYDVIATLKLIRVPDFTWRVDSIDIKNK